MLFACLFDCLVGFVWSDLVLSGFVGVVGLVVCSFGCLLVRLFVVLFCLIWVVWCWFGLVWLGVFGVFVCLFVCSFAWLAGLAW